MFTTMMEWLSKWRARWMDLHPFVRLLITISFLAIVGVFVAKPSYRVARHWWYGRKLVEAEQALSAGEMEKAKLLSRTLLQAGDPRVLESLRILEQSMSALRDPFRADIARALMSHPDATAEDRLRGFKVLASYAPLGLAGQAWMSLPEESRAKPEFLYPFADRLFESGRLKEAAGLIQSAARAGIDWQMERRMIRILIASENEYAIVEAHNRLEKSWPPEDKVSGLELLESIPIDLLKPGLLRASAGRLDSSVAREALMLARLAFAKDNAPREEVVDKAVADWRPTAGLEVAEFLLATGMRRRLLEEFPPSEMAKFPTLAEKLVEAAVEEKEWTLAKEYLKAAPETLEKTTRLVWTAVVLEQAGDAAASEAAWREAAIEAEAHREAEAWLKMGKILRAAGMTAREDECMYQAVLRGRGRLPLFEDLQPLMERYYAQGREKAMLQICGGYLALEPGNPEVLTHHAYLSCVTGGGDPELLTRVMEPIAEAYPSSPRAQSVLISIYLLRGDFEAAGRVAERITVPIEALLPRYRAAVLCAKVKTGVLSADSEEVRSIPWQSMMAPERRFFRRILEMKEQDEKTEEISPEGEKPET
jgi:hypothetical protein